MDVFLSNYVSLSIRLKVSSYVVPATVARDLTADACTEVKQKYPTHTGRCDLRCNLARVFWICTSGEHSWTSVYLRNL